MNQFFLGPKIRFYRKKAGMSQGDLTRALRIDQSNVANWEHDRRPVPKYRLVQLATVLGITVQEFTDMTFIRFLPEYGSPPRYREYRLTCWSAAHESTVVWLEERGRLEVAASRYRCGQCRSAVYITEDKLLMDVDEKAA